MRRLSDTVRTGLAVAAGLLLAAGVAGTAAADEPDPPPIPFEASDMGEDACTVFQTDGQAQWRDAGTEDSRVEVSGQSFAVATPGAPGGCLPVIPADRQVEFTAFADGTAVDERIEPIDVTASSAEYQFSFADADHIDHLTVAVCLERRSDGSTWSDRCGWATTVYRDGEPGEPQPYHYEFALPDACLEGTVDATVQWIGDSRVRLQGTATTQRVDSDMVCDPIEWPPVDYEVRFAANHNDWVVEELSVPLEPIENGGEFTRYLPSDFDIVTDIHYVVAKVCGVDSSGGAHGGCRTDSIESFEPEPVETAYCEYSYQLINDWGNGFQGQVTIAPLVEALHDWEVILTFDGGQQVQAAWNAEWTQSGDTVAMTNTSWNGVIPVGSTVSVGFVASGPSDPPPTVEVYGNGRACVAA